ncbi:MAG: DUF86 domain-containing protein [Anaerolineae bacterium]|nr:DUF86 domain-containing protein [Anaerolineae bacterium]
MSSRTDRALLRDIREAIRRIEDYTAAMTYEAFLDDTRTQDAVLRNLEVLGEAAKRVSPALRNKHPEIPWREMARLRDRLIHHYFGVNLDIVWHVATVDLRGVAAQVEGILQEFGGTP